MADNNFDIFVRILTQQVGSEKAQDILKKVREESVKTGKEGVKQQEAVEKSTGKVSEAMKSLRQNISHVSRAFPTLGEFGRIALNPIAVAIFGIVGAVKLWIARTKELTESLGGVELPNVRQDDVTRIDALAKAYGHLAEKALATKTSLDLVKTAIEGNAAFMKALGIDVGNQPERQKLSATQQEAARLATAGHAKLKEAGAFNPDNNQLEELAKLATAAQAEKDKINARIADIQSNRELGRFDPRRLYRDFQFRTRYGYGTSYDQAEGIERSGLASQQQIIDRYAYVSRNRAERGAAFAAGNGDIAQAEELRRTVPGQLFGIAAGTAGAGAGGINNAAGKISSGDLTQLAGGVVELAQNFQLILQAIQELKKANAASRNVIRTQNQINQ